MTFFGIILSIPLVVNLVALRPAVFHGRADRIEIAAHREVRRYRSSHLRVGHKVMVDRRLGRADRANVLERVTP